MNLVAMTIPDDPTELAGWLDRLVVGPDLGRLVAELTAVHGEPVGGAADPEEVLGTQVQAVLAGGLGHAAPAAVRQLLIRPRSLLALQERILTEGGSYWDALANSQPELDELAESGLGRVVAALAGRSVNEEAVVLRPAPPTTMVPPAWYGRPWFVSLATAAAVLACVYTGARQFGLFSTAANPPAVAWGWARPGALPEDAPPAAYLNGLADAAGDWSKKRPDDPAGLARRIGEFRQGCSALILAEHKPLSEKDRQWLKERCRTWAGKLDLQLTALEAGEEPLKVRDNVDAIVKRLVDALHERAKDV
jgi:hypothetical protein